MPLDVKKIREHFPILKREIGGSSLVYLDNAATSQKPQQVIDSIANYYENHNANVHRGIHSLSDEATNLYEESREKIARSIGAADPTELIFTKGTTDGINATALTLKSKIKADDEIIVSSAEHHSNFVPWQRVCEEKNAELRVIDYEYFLSKSLNELPNLISDKTKVLCISHASNVLGTIFPIMGISKILREKSPEAFLVVDGAQSVPHIPTNVQKLGCDFLAFSGHKMLGPMGIGGLWIKKSHLENLDPFYFGGGMISQVSAEKSTWAEPPHKYEAGTPNVAGAVGLAAAVEYLENLGMKNVKAHSQELTAQAVEKLGKIPQVEILGPLNAEERTGLVSFTVKGAHPHDVAAVLNSKGIAVRAGQHCTMPLHEKLELPATVRASFYIYNTSQEVDYFIESLKEGMKILL